jgi:hypothetical protein
LALSPFFIAAFIVLIPRFIGPILLIRRIPPARHSGHRRQIDKMGHWGHPGHAPMISCLLCVTLFRMSRNSNIDNTQRAPRSNTRPTPRLTSTSPETTNRAAGLPTMDRNQDEIFTSKKSANYRK